MAKPDSVDLVLNASIITIGGLMPVVPSLLTVFHNSKTHQDPSLHPVSTPEAYVILFGDATRLVLLAKAAHSLLAHESFTQLATEIGFYTLIGAAITWVFLSSASEQG